MLFNYKSNIINIVSYRRKMYIKVKNVHHSKTILSQKKNVYLWLVTILVDVILYDTSCWTLSNVNNNINIIEYHYDWKLIFLISIV